MATTKELKEVYKRWALLYDLDELIWLGAKQHWRKKVIDHMNVEKANLILDVATGTGRAAKILSKRSNGQVIVVDFCKNMLRLARIRNRGRRNITFILCDVSHLPFKKSIFDAATCTCAMGSIEDNVAMLSEVTRVLRDGKRFGMLYLSEPRGWLKHFFAPLMKLYAISHSRYVDLSPITAKLPLTIIQDDLVLLAATTVVEKEAI